MEVFEDPEPGADVGILRNHAAAFIDKVFDVFAECVFSGGDAFHGDDGKSSFADDVHEGLLHAADLLAVRVEFLEFAGGDAVGGSACSFSVEKDVRTGGEEFGPADEAEVFCDAVEGMELLVCYVDVDVFSHGCDDVRALYRHGSQIMGQ